MKKNKLNIISAIKKGWNMTISKFWGYVFYSGVFILVGALAGEIPYVGLVIQYALILSSLVAIIRLNNGADFNFNILKITWRQLFVFFITTLVIMSVFVPLVMLILVLNNVAADRSYLAVLQSNPYFALAITLSFVFGAYMATRLSYSPFAILEMNHGPMKSIKHSWDITEGSSLKIFVLGLASVFMLSLGLIGFLIGVFVAYPIIYFAFVDSYKQLNNNDQENIK